MKNVGLLFKMDISAALHSKWFWGYVVLIVLSIATIFATGVTDSRVMGFTGLTRLLLIFIQATNLVLPIFILVSTVRTLVKERETNVFEYLLSYPISLGQYYWAKALARYTIIALPLVVSLALADVLSLLRGQSVPWSLSALYAGLLLASTLYYIGLSFLTSSLVKTQEMGLAVALTLWLILVAFLDMVLLGLLIKALVPENIIYSLALLNPIQVFKMAAISLFDPVLSVVGPVAYFLLDNLGQAGLIAYALLYLSASGLLFLLLGYWRFSRKDLL